MAKDFLNLMKTINYIPQSSTNSKYDKYRALHSAISLQMLKDMENLEDSEKETHHVHGDLINIVN